jgi:hypothetical protein
VARLVLRPATAVLNATTRTGSLYRPDIRSVGGFEIGFAEIGFRECRAKCRVIIDDDIKSLVVAVRHNRGSPISAHMRKLPMQRDTGKSKHESEPR